MNEKQNLSIFTRFLVFCSGADLRTLETCSKRTTAKYTGLGALVLAPAVMALVSSYYFLSTIFKTQTLVVMAGSLIWSLIIFNIDRFLVMSYQKSAYYSRKGAFSLAVIGRLAVAAFFAYSIAHVLVLSLFEGNIEEYIFSQNLAKKQAITEGYENIITRKEDEIKILNQEIAKEKAILHPFAQIATNEEIQNLEREINRNHDALADEIAGQSKRTGKKGHGPVAKAIEAKLRHLENQRKEAMRRYEANLKDNSKSWESQEKHFQDLEQRINSVIKGKREEISKLNQQKEEELRAFEAKAADDFLTRSNALDELARLHFNVWKWSWVLTAIFVSIDIMAVLLKMILPKDEYEWKLETDQLAAEANELVKRTIISKTKENQEKVALQRWHQEDLEAQMKNLLDHKISMLGMLSTFIEIKVKQEIAFAEKMNAYKEDLKNAKDQNGWRATLEKGIPDNLYDYFAHSDEMYKDASKFFSRNFNGG